MTTPLHLPEGFSTLFHEEITSTNDEACRLARAGAPALSLVWAKTQSRGRGRRAREWVSPPGNLYFSFLLRPRVSPGIAAQISFVAALSLGEALSPFVPSPRRLSFKWPNDLLLEGRKLAGILLESQTGASGQLDWLVVGIGVNLRSAPEGTAFPAIALAECAITPPDPGTLLEAFAPAFLAWQARWETQGFAPVRASWLAHAAGVGKTISVALEEERLTGVFCDLDEEGGLCLDLGGGRQRRITAGDVFFS